MLQKLGKIKCFFLREYSLGHFSSEVTSKDSVVYWGGTIVLGETLVYKLQHFLVEFVMAVRMILSLLKQVPNSVKYSTSLCNNNIVKHVNRQHLSWNFYVSF